jgi:hypothetical protein
MPLPIAEGNHTFHVVVDFTNQSFSMNGFSTNGVWLHYEVHKVARGLQNRFWEFDIQVNYSSMRSQKCRNISRVTDSWARGQMQQPR